METVTKVKGHQSKRGQIYFYFKMEQILAVVVKAYLPVMSPLHHMMRVVYQDETCGSSHNQKFTKLPSSGQQKWTSFFPSQRYCQQATLCLFSISTKGGG